MYANCCQVGASVEQDTAYPGWVPNPGSAVVKLAQEVLTDVTGREVKVGILLQSLTAWAYCDSPADWRLRLCGG